MVRRSHNSPKANIGRGLFEFVNMSISLVLSLEHDMMSILFVDDVVSKTILILLCIPSDQSASFFLNEAGTSALSCFPSRRY